MLAEKRGCWSFLRFGQHLIFLVLRVLCLFFFLNLTPLWSELTVWCSLNLFLFDWRIYSLTVRSRAAYWQQSALFSVTIIGQSPWSHHFMANRWGNSGNSGCSKITADGDCNHEIKMLTPWEESYDQPRQHIKKQRHSLDNKVPSKQG